jgi:AbrB family looped-hinge helix DNA binding protein
MGVVSKEFQVVIPPSVRKAAGIRPGQRVKVSASNGVITITPERTGASDPAAGFGMLKAKFHVDIEDMHGGYRRTKE